MPLNEAGADRKWESYADRSDDNEEVAKWILRAKRLTLAGSFA